MGNPFKKIETQEHRFSFEQLATALVKAGGYHEGLWRLRFDFDVRSASIKVPTDRGDQLVPAAFTPIMSVSLYKVDKIDELTVDAAAVNPRPRLIHTLN